MHSGQLFAPSNDPQAFNEATAGSCQTVIGRNPELQFCA